MRWPWRRKFPRVRVILNEPSGGPGVLIYSCHAHDNHTGMISWRPEGAIEERTSFFFYLPNREVNLYWHWDDESRFYRFSWEMDEVN